jgi:3-isopropylmalate dehydrogenase
MYLIAIASGDGIGPEVCAEAVKVLNAVGLAFGHTFRYVEALVGGAAWEQTGEHLPAATLEACATADAILFGSVGGPVSEQSAPKWANAERNAILGMRKHFSLAINIRPSKVWPSLANLSPLKAEIIGAGVDIVIIRELVGGAYFGAHETSEDGRFARDDMTYTWEQAEAALRFGFLTACGRGKRLTVVDKANVLETSRLWRRVTKALELEYPDVAVEFMYVDNAAMQLVTRPTAFDVIVTENLFGDILSDEASVLSGSLGLMPSASLTTCPVGVSASGRERQLHLFEPIGGTAPDIAGKGVANPIAQILSAALLLRYGLKLEAEAAAIEAAVDAVLAGGARTGDIRGKGEEGTRLVGTAAMGDAIVAEVGKRGWGTGTG